MKKINIILLIMLFFVFSATGVMAESSYLLTDVKTDITTRYVDFIEKDGNVIASTSVSNLVNKSTIALILTEYKGDTVVNTKIDCKEITESGDFSVSMPKNSESVYKAYVWNYTSLTPYTNIAEYPSKSVEIEKLYIGNVEIDTSVKEYTFNLLNEENFPLVTGAPLNNGTKVTVKVSSDTLPGKVTICVYSSDGTAQDEIVINLNDITPELSHWFKSIGFDTSVGITTHVIKEGDL